MAAASKAVESAILPLVCAVQHYDWGMKGSASAVARLSSAGGKVSAENENKPYAELWMGTHKNAPSKAVVGTGTDSKQIPLRDALGGVELPYLFKVLSVRTALSIQAHPTRSLGAALHKSAPQHYPDANHKPEMTIALHNRFEALCGFRPLTEIAHFLSAVPELRSVVGESTASQFQSFVTATAAAAAATLTATGTEYAANELAPSQPPKSAKASDRIPAWPILSAAAEADAKSAPAEKAVLQAVFSAVMNADSKVVATQLAAVVKRFTAEISAAAGSGSGSGDQKQSLSYIRDVSIKELVIRLSIQYPNDVGVFCAFLLNAINLYPGQSIFLPANEPHAYLSGDCIECMAASDNVVRAGLTPKFRDVKVLCDMLTYRSGRPPVHTGVAIDAYTRSYVPPVPEFMASSTQLPANTEYTLAGVNGPSIVLIVDGSASLTASSLAAPISVLAGSTLLVGSNVSAVIKTGASGGVQLFRCSPNSAVLE